MSGGRLDPGGEHADVVVIGGGIVGTAAAAYLAAEGVGVTLIEREGLASGASGANSGVVQHPFDPVLARLYRGTVALYRELAAADAGFRLPDEPAGLLYVSRDGAVARGLADTVARGFPELACEVLEGPALERLEPALAPGLTACHVGMGYPVHPGSSTYAYATLAERLGARIRLGRSATLVHRADDVVGVIVDGISIACGAVVAAAGPWTPELIDPAGRWLPIVASWGIVVETELADGPRHVIEEAEIDAQLERANGTTPDSGLHSDVPSFSLVPVEGVATVGSTFLAREPDPEAWLERILVGAAAFVPAVADAPIRGVRACARPQSVDARPLVGRVPGRRGLFVCAGHGPWGISTGPASARMVVDQILGRDPVVPAELDPARFSGPGRAPSP